MPVTLFATPIAFIVVMLLIGFVAGVAITVLFYRTQRLTRSDTSDSAVYQRDPKNPYEPSTVSFRASNGTTGCVIASVVLLIAAITAIALAATFFFAATSVVKSVPVPMPPPPIVVQPQQTPTIEPATPSN